MLKNFLFKLFYSAKMKNIPKVTRFDGIIRILGCNSGPMTLQGTNSYLIGKGPRWALTLNWIVYYDKLINHNFRRVLIDTSEPNKPDYVKLLENVLNEENSKISAIIATHFHHDHIGSIKEIVSKKLVSDDCKIWKFPRSDVNESENTYDVKFEELKNNQEFDIGSNIKLKVHHTPGHTTDHVILFDEVNRALFAGDCILGEGTAIFEDLYDYMKSLELILKLNPVVIYPGHADVINDPVDRVEYYISHRNEREQQILDAISSSNKNLCLQEIVEKVYSATPKHLWPAASVNVHQHLIKLKKEQKIVPVEEGNVTLWKAKLWFMIAACTIKAVLITFAWNKFSTIIYQNY